MATIKRLLAGKDEPMAMGNDFYEFDIFYTAIYFDKEDVLKYALTRYKDINNRLYSDEYGLTLPDIRLQIVQCEVSPHIAGAWH